MKTLRNKVVFITGAGSGFGRALALEVASRGAIPVIADISADGIAETARLLDALGAKHLSATLDVRDAAAWQRTAEEAERALGGIDVLINNAGVLSRAESFLELSEEHCRFVFDVNFWGMFHGTRTLVPYLAKRPEAHVVNTSSSLALIGTPMHTIYCASKAAVANYTAVLREELAATRIGVTIVYPGASKTNLGRNVPADSAEQREANAKNFEKFATTSADRVARAIVTAILRRQAVVVTGLDGKAMRLMQRLAPGFGHWMMAAAYRRISDPRLFARLRSLGAAP
jgi:NADP-dependent 3-hydroxy acid dehydrogenase YdfG